MFRKHISIFSQSLHKSVFQTSHNNLQNLHDNNLWHVITQSNKRGILQYSTSIFNLDISGEEVNAYFKNLRQAYANLDIKKTKPKKLIWEIEPLLKELNQVNQDKDELFEIVEGSNDKELVGIATSDINIIEESECKLHEQILKQVIASETPSFNSITVDITPGVGGKEAQLFADQLFGVYLIYANKQSWNIKSDRIFEAIGGIRKGTLHLSGKDCYNVFKFEGGIHRVQRVPATEKSGRIHTSTVSVVVMPVPSEIDIHISEKDMKYETFSPGGPGGQSVNKSESAVRGHHIPSGFSAECRENRAHHRNKAMVLTKLRTMIFNQQFESQARQYSSQRKLQAGTRSRSEKIRTYNFPSSRVTDHRIGHTTNNLTDYFAGGKSFAEMLQKVSEAGREEDIKELLKRPLL